jgi:hypothetical protein
VHKCYRHSSTYGRCGQFISQKSNVIYFKKTITAFSQGQCTVQTASDCQRIISGVYGRTYRQLSLVLTSKKELHTHITVCWVFPCLMRPLITEDWFRSPANACEICVVQSGCKTKSGHSALVSPRQYNSTLCSRLNHSSTSDIIQFYQITASLN